MDKLGIILERHLGWIDDYSVPESYLMLFIVMASIYLCADTLGIFDGE